MPTSNLMRPAESPRQYALKGKSERTARRNVTRTQRSGARHAAQRISRYAIVLGEWMVHRVNNGSYECEIKISYVVSNAPLPLPTLFHRCLLASSPMCLERLTALLYMCLKRLQTALLHNPRCVSSACKWPFCTFMCLKRLRTALLHVCLKRLRRPLRTGKAQEISYC